MRTLINRALAFLRGDQEEAEGLTGFPAVGRPAIIDSVSSTEELKLLLEAAERSATKADEALKSIQDKAASFATLLIAILPIAFAGTAFAIAIHERHEGALMFGAIVVFLVGDGLLTLAAVIAVVTTGLAYSGWVSIARVDETGPHADGVDNLRADIADAWHFASMTAAESSTRKGRDLFAARRAAAAAFLMFLLAFVLIAFAAGGDVGILA